jgi:hypothetical protein
LLPPAVLHQKGGKGMISITPYIGKITRSSSQELKRNFISEFGNLFLGGTRV